MKKGLTQSELAKGIISFSYLSKIENGKTKPNRDIIDLLCKRLNISPLGPTIFEANVKTCKRWFKSLLLGDRKTSTKLFEEITSNSTIFSNKSLANLININKLRYFVLTAQSYNASKQMKVLKRKASQFNNKEQYYWLKFSGNYYFSIMSYQKAYKRFQCAEKLISSELYFKEEENDIFYLIGLAASKIRKAHIALVYTSKALQYYQSQYKLAKCAQSHIVLGISYRRINDLEKAKQSYEMAIRIGESLENNNLVSLSYQNLGVLHSANRDNKKAIIFFQKNYEILSGQDSMKLLVPIASLMKEYYKINDYINASYWLEQGLNLTNSLDVKESIFVLDFKVYEQLLSQKNSLKIEEIILTEAIPYLEKNKLDYQKHIYLQILADYYYRIRNYKLAADYYAEVNEILKTIYHD